MFGKDLNHVRKRAGISISKMAEEMCITEGMARELESIENMDMFSKEYFFALSYEYKMELLCNKLGICFWRIFEDFALADEFEYNSNSQIASHVWMDDNSHVVFLFDDELGERFHLKHFTDEDAAYEYQESLEEQIGVTNDYVQTTSTILN